MTWDKRRSSPLCIGSGLGLSLKLIVQHIIVAKRMPNKRYYGTVLGGEGWPCKQTSGAHAELLPIEELSYEVITFFSRQEGPSPQRHHDRSRKCCLCKRKHSFKAEGRAFSFPDNTNLLWSQPLRWFLGKLGMLC